MISFRIKKTELFIIAAIVTVAAVILFSVRRNDGSYCKISIIGGASVFVGLEKDRTFSAFGMENVVFEIKDGGIAFVQSDCPDKICVGMGTIKSVGATAVCLPNKISIEIAPGVRDSDAPDTVAD